MAEFTFQRGRLERANKVWTFAADSGSGGRLYAVLVIAPIGQADPPKTVDTVAGLLSLTNYAAYPGFSAGSWPTLPTMTATRDDPNSKVLLNSPGVVDYGSPASSGGDPIHGVAVAYRVGVSQTYANDFLCSWWNTAIKGGNGTGGPMTIAIPTDWFEDVAA